MHAHMYSVFARQGVDLGKGYFCTRSIIMRALFKFTCDFTY